MAQNELIERMPDPEGGRVFRVLLTKKVSPITAVLMAVILISSAVALAKDEIVHDQDKLPLDPREAIMQVPEWDNLDSGWGVGK